jgi:hypothetical protein
MGDDIFDFCLSFILYFCLMGKKGLLHDERTKSIAFLQAVWEPAYVDVITMLQAHIDTFLSKEDFGYLPPNLCMMGLAGQMNKNAHARVRDVVPQVAHRLVWQQDDWPPSTPEIQGFCSPKVYRTDIPRDCHPYDGYHSRPNDRRYDSREFGHEAVPRHERDGGGSHAW